jgi:hypothetical protein
MTNQTTFTDESSYEGPWKAWIAKGLEQDKAHRSRATGVVVSVAIGFAVWLVALAAL